MRRKQSINMDAPTKTAIKLHETRGHLVIGFPPNAILAPEMIGQTLRRFAQADLKGHRLVVEAETNRRDWDEQVYTLYGTKVPKLADHPAKDGQKFYRCNLEVC